MSYRYLEDIATADVAFEVESKTLEELFADAADATVNVMVQNLDSIERAEELDLSAEAETVDMLLFAFLQELIFYKDAKELLLRIDRLEVENSGLHYRVKASSYGEKIDPAKHNLVVDVKAVTLHRFRVEETATGWEATVILDI